jgi:hypothetical protein
MVSGGIPRRAASWAAINGPGAVIALVIPAAAAAGIALNMSRRFIRKLLPVFLV